MRALRAFGNSVPTSPATVVAAAAASAAANTASADDVANGVTGWLAPCVLHVDSRRIDDDRHRSTLICVATPAERVYTAARRSAAR